MLDDGDPVRLSLAGSSSAALVPPLSVPDDALARRTVESAAPVWEGPPPGGQSAALGVPVRVSGQTLAVLEVRSPRAREQDPGWVATLGDVGSQLGLFLKRQRAEADLQRFARYDGLTGLPNRTFFLDTLERTLARARRRRSRLALIFLDLDGFKAVNDRFGHATGDAVLQIMAERLRAGTRSSDLVARIGGDEFTVLLQSLARADDAALVARALIDRLARPCTVEDQEIALGASAGIAVYPEDGTDADALLRNADLAMYRAKQEGRNTYRFFTAEMSERALERMLLLDGLRVALERDEFELVYLPVFRVGGGPTGLEALLRWRHPKLGLVAPAAFIAQAEESGLILPIGTRVLRMATRFVASLPTQEIRLIVNLSTRQFLQPNLVEVVRQALEQSGLPASRLELDLTEPTVMAENDETGERIRVLREMGVLHRPRRLRHRLLLDRPAARARHRAPQDRPLLRRRPARPRGPRGPGAGDPRPRPRARPRGGGRGCRDRGPARLPARARLRRAAGLPAQPAARRRGRGRLRRAAIARARGETD